MFHLEDYLDSHCSAEPSYLAAVAESTRQHVLNPRMLCGRVEGMFLRMFSSLVRPQRVLELGTYTGYSALCLAEGLQPTGSLITIEHNDELEDRIRSHFALTPLGQKIELVIDDAVDYLNSYQDCHLFDLVFIDADKRQYPDYYELVFPLVRRGGYILADNTLWDGHIQDPAYDHDPQTLGLRRFNDMVVGDTRVNSMILPLRDGLTIIEVL